jgi:glycosyltransferase involved in cell wall biosynthesis
MTYTILIILTPAFDPNTGGVQHSTYKMSSYFKSQGHDTHVFSYQDNGHAQQNVAHLHSANREGKHKNILNNSQLQELIEKIQPDIVINQMPYEREIGSALSEIHTKQKFLLLGCLRNTLFTVKLNLTSYIRTVMPKYIQSVFNNFLGKQIFLYLHKKKHKKDLQFILDTYDYFVMFGPPNIQELKYFVGDYKLHKTHLIPNSIPTVLAEVPPKEKRILWLSRLGYGQKRADLILPFWKKIMHELPDWQFDIVGDGNAYNDLKKQIEQENIPRVTLYGKQVPNEYYKRSPIYIMTSENEGFPNTLIEAQSFGAIPVVYDNYPICSWVVKDGESGVLITPFKVDEMVQEVICIASDQKRQNQLMQAAIKNARKFEINKVGKQWVEFFDSHLMER